MVKVSDKTQDHKLRVSVTCIGVMSKGCMIDSALFLFPSTRLTSILSSMYCFHSYEVKVNARCIVLLVLTFGLGRHIFLHGVPLMSCSQNDVIYVTNLSIV